MNLDQFKERYHQAEDDRPDEFPAIIYYPISKTVELFPDTETAGDEFNSCREPIPHSFIELGDLKNLEIKHYSISESFEF